MNKKTIPHISLELNNSCNQDCVFCYNHIPHSTPAQKSNYTKIKRLLKAIYSQAQVQNITFTGGEPLLESRLSELVLYAKMKKSITSIISNGTLFTEENISNLLTVKNNLFQLPIHSADSQIHDKMTRLPGSHIKSSKAILRLSQSGAVIVAVVVLTKHNIERISNTLEYIQRLGISQISIDRYNIGGKSVNNFQDILPTSLELKNAYHLINEISLQNKLIISSNVCTPHCILDPREFPHIKFGNCAANPLQFPLTADLEGNLRVCNHSPKIAGNIYEQNIFDILNSSYVKSWAENIPSFCCDCGLWLLCRGGCRAAAEQSGLNNSYPDPIIEKLKNKATNF